MAFSESWGGAQRQAFALIGEYPAFETPKELVEVGAHQIGLMVGVIAVPGLEAKSEPAVGSGNPPWFFGVMAVEVEDGPA